MGVERLGGAGSEALRARLSSARSRAQRAGPVSEAVAAQGQKRWLSQRVAAVDIAETCVLPRRILLLREQRRAGRNAGACACAWRG